jgi:hypothetical protein
VVEEIPGGNHMQVESSAAETGSAPDPVSNGSMMLTAVLAMTLVGWGLYIWATIMFLPDSY